MAKTAQEKADLKAEKLYEKTHKNRYRTSVGDQIFNVINYVVYTLFTIICIFPFYYLFINTISDNDLVVKGLINFIPRGIHFGNYAALLNVSDLMSSFIVSVTRTVFGTALMVAASAFIGYLVTQQEMWGRKVWYRFIVITMYFNAGLIPWFLNMQMLGLIDTDVHMTKRLSMQFGYVTLNALCDTAFFKKNTNIRAHEFHYSKADKRGDSCEIKKYSGKCWNGLYVKENIMAGYPHFYFHNCREVAERFVDMAEKISKNLSM